LEQSEKWALTEEGKKMAENGSYEAIVYNAVSDTGLLQSELQVYQFPLSLHF